MKRKIISLLVFMFVVLCAQAQRIEVEPRVGISYSGEESGNFGFHAGIACFQNLTDQGSYFNLSLGYRISL